jgi:hypothetical protein
MLYGDDVAKTYVTPGWNPSRVTLGQEEVLEEIAAMGT